MRCKLLCWCPLRLVGRPKSTTEDMLTAGNGDHASFLTDGFEKDETELGEYADPDAGKPASNALTL